MAKYEYVVKLSFDDEALSARWSVTVADPDGKISTAQYGTLRYVLRETRKLVWAHLRARLDWTRRP